MPKNAEVNEYQVILDLKPCKSNRKKNEKLSSFCCLYKIELYQVYKIDIVKN